MFETEKFIGLIEKQSVLWDRDHDNYTDRNNREKAWVEIGEEMFEEWRELDAVQQVEKVKEMKGKWRHIRDSFNKFLTQERISDTGVKRKKYIYADHCGFLINTRGTKKSLGNNIESPNDFDDKGRKEKKAGNGEQKLNNWLLEESSETRDSKLKVSRPGHRQLLKKLKDNFRKEEEDADKFFLMSLLPDYRKLSSPEKTQFKLMTVQFFDRAQQKCAQNQQCPTSALYLQNPYVNMGPFNYPHPVFSVQTFYPLHSSSPMIIHPSVSVPLSSLPIPPSTSAPVHNSQAPPSTQSLHSPNHSTVHHPTEFVCTELHTPQFDGY